MGTRFQAEPGMTEGRGRRYPFCLRPLPLRGGEVAEGAIRCLGGLRRVLVMDWAWYG